MVAYSMLRLGFLGSFSLMLLGYACKSTTEDDVTVGGIYSWRGRILDSLTGEPAAGIIIRVRELDEHRSAGWSPDPADQRFGVGGFLYSYVLSGPVCASRRDTSLTLHLEFVDTLAQYQAVVHTSEWVINYCDGFPPSNVPKPFPSEDNLEIQMQPDS